MKYDLVIPWYIKLLLWFRPVRISFDNGFDDRTVLYYKTLFGVTYIIGEEYSNMETQ